MAFFVLLDRGIYVKSIRVEKGSLAGTAPRRLSLVSLDLLKIATLRSYIADTWCAMLVG